jgi:hypothetical protein
VEKTMIRRVRDGERRIRDCNEEKSRIIKDSK